MDENDNTMIQNLLGEMNADEYEKILAKQIQNEEEDYTTPPIDHFSELYERYTSTLDLEDADEDDKRELANRFERICQTIILCINGKFDTDVDVDKVIDTEPGLPFVTLALYRFFILDFKSNLTTIIRRYLESHMEDIYKQFANLDQKKDVVTASNKKYFSDQMAVIVSNIYDISDYVFTMLDEYDVTNYCEEGDVVAAAIHKLVDTCVMPGKFVDIVAGIYRGNTDLKAQVCFQIIYAIKEGTIRDVFASQSPDNPE